MWRAHHDLAAAAVPGSLLLPDAVTVGAVEARIYRRLRQHGLSEATAGVHAGVRETSHVWAVSSESVRASALEAGALSDLVNDEVGFLQGIRDVSRNGILGDARCASEELGRELNELLVDLYTEVFSDARAREEKRLSG